MDVKKIFKEVVYGIVPILIIVILLEVTIVKLPTEVFVNFLSGTLLVVIGLTLFLIGIELGFLPIGDLIGNSLVKKGSLRLIVLFGFIIGFAVTLPEPDVQAFTAQAKFIMSNLNANALVIATALGVGFYTTVAFIRIFLNIPIKYIIAFSYLLTFILLLFCPKEFATMAFDVGGVTTGALTTPFVMSLGVGISSMISKKESTATGFGILGIATIGPIIAVLIMGVIQG